MKLTINGHVVRTREIHVESMDGLKSLLLDFANGEVRAFRYNRPHTNAAFRWDDDKYFHGTVEQAIKEHVVWINKSDAVATDSRRNND